MITLAPYAKAVTAGVGEVVTAGTAITALLTLVPVQNHGVAVVLSVLLGGLGVLKTVQVWLVKNEPLAEQIDQAIATAEPTVAAVRSMIVGTKVAPESATTRPNSAADPKPASS